MLDMRSVKSDDPVLAQCVHFTLVKIEKGIGIGIDPNHKMRELFTLNNTVSILVVPFKLLESIRELSTHVPKKVNTCNDTVLFNFSRIALVVEPNSPYLSALSARKEDS